MKHVDWFTSATAVILCIVGLLVGTTINSKSASASSAESGYCEEDICDVHEGTHHCTDTAGTFATNCNLLRGTSDCQQTGCGEDMEN